jgi:hypothetical protein
MIVEQTPHNEAFTGGPVSSHETSDLDARVPALFGAALTTAIIVLMAATYWMYDFTVAHHAARYPAAPPLAYTREPTPAPRLQVDAPRELRELRAAEDAALHGYAWIDKNRSHVRIPIDRAIDLLAQRGLPARAHSAAGDRGGEKSGDGKHGSAN